MSESHDAPESLRRLRELFIKTLPLVIHMQQHPEQYPREELDPQLLLYARKIIAGESTAESAADQLIADLGLNWN